MKTSKNILLSLLLFELIFKLIQEIDSRKYDEINQIKNYIGCFKYFNNSKECKTDHHDVLSCLSCCYKHNSSFIGLKGEGRCFCGETFEWSSDECRTECLGSKDCYNGEDYNIFSVCEIGFHGYDCKNPCDSCRASIPCSRNHGTCLYGCSQNNDGCDLSRLFTDVNTAFNQPVKQSSNYSSTRNISYPAERAVDGEFVNNFGNDDSYCTHTIWEQNSWFYVDLGKHVSIKSVNITNRGPDYGYRLSGVKIHILKDLPLDLFNFNDTDFCNKKDDITNNDINIVLKCEHPIAGRYVIARLEKIEILTICEIEIFQQDCTVNKNCMHNEQCQNMSLNGVEYNRCVCSGGYTRRHLSSQCQDIDECKGVKYPCGNNTVCTNDDGGYYCSCKHGYQGDSASGCIEVANPVATVLACLFVLLVLVIIALLVYFLKSYRKRTKLIDKEKMVLSDLSKDTKNTKIKIEDLGSYILDVVGTKTNGFADQFEKIPVSANYTVSASKGPGVKGKNRFANIVPYDYNRVLLGKVPGNGHDYINASHIETGHKRRFIATQGPKDNTVDQFWQMIYEQDVSDIVMLTQTIEKSKNKCYQYWPDEDDKTFGEYKIVLESTVDFEEYIRRVFTVTSCNPWESPKSVTQWQYICWPDYGVPINIDSFLKFHDVVVKYSNSEKLMLVHCSAGVGRTGCFIAIDMLLEEIDKEGCVDVVACVTKLREQRMCIVQSAIQYDFIYYALKCHASLSYTYIPLDKVYNNVIDKRTDLSEEFLRLRQESNFLDKRGKVKCKSKHYWISSFMGVTASNHHHISYYPDSRDLEEFWSFCYHTNCFLIILEDSEHQHHNFIPTTGNSIIMNNIFVEYLNKSDNTFEVSVSRRSLEENFYENKISTVRKVIIPILIVTSDQCNQLTPELFMSAKQKIDLLNVDKVYKNLYIIGPSKSSLTSYFVACCDLTDQMKSSEDVDVGKVLVELLRNPLNETITLELLEKLHQFIGGQSKRPLM